MAAIFFLVIIILLFVLLRRLLKVNEQWKKRGLPYRRPYPFVGNMFENLIRKKTLGVIIKEICEEFKNKPIIGVYNYTSPAMIINNLDYTYIIGIKEFSHFMNRGPEIKNRRRIDRHLFSLTGVEWRAVRMKMTPIFTTGKLKGMLSMMENCFDKIKNEIDSKSLKNIRMRDITDRYSINVRGYCVFGLDNDMDEKLAKQLNEVNDFNLIQFLRIMLNVFFPRLATKLNLTMIGRDLEDRIARMLVDTIQTRMDTGIRKNDFIQTLLQLKQTGHVEVGQWVEEDDYLKMGVMPHMHQNITTVAITDEHIFAQSMIFLLAGLDVLKSSITLMLFELAKDHEVYKRLQKEVDTTMQNYKQFSYEAIKDMKYFDMCIKETLRMYPPAEIGVRMCVKEFTFPDGTKVEKGTQVFLPFKRFHWDPSYFPQPEKFIPDRFSDGDPPAYLAFGLGPRQCIAMRFAMLEMKMFLSKFIYNYDFELDSKTVQPIQFENWFFLLKIKSDVFLRVHRRNQNIQ